MKFHFALLGVLCALALARDESSKALKATAPVTQATWNNVALHTNLKSALFAKCITAANTRKIQYFAIDWPAQGIELVKYAANRFEKSLTPVSWDKEIQCNDVLDCSKASKDYIMFQYDGQTCRMSNRTYYECDFCDSIGGLAKDVVYFTTARGASGCPANTDIIVGDKGPVCIAVFQQDMLFTSDDDLCGRQLFIGGVYAGGRGVKFNTLRNYMRDKKYQGEFYVSVRYDNAAKTFKWTVASSEFNNSFIAVQPREPHYERIAVISSSHDYLLVMKNYTDLLTGYVCMGFPRN